MLTGNGTINTNISNTNNIIGHAKDGNGQSRQIRFVPSLTITDHYRPLRSITEHYYNYNNYGGNIDV